MPDTVNTRDMLNEIFDDIADEDNTDALAAAAEEEKKESEEEEESKEESKEEEEEEEEETEEEESEEEEEEEETEEEEEETEEKEAEKKEEEKEEKEVDKEKKEDYNRDESRIIKVDGEEITVDTDTAFSNFQLKTASDRRFKEAAESKKETEVFWDSLLANPGDALVDRIVDEHCGGDRVKARGVVIQVLLDWMTPERQLAEIEDPKEQGILAREQAMDVRQQETERRESLRIQRQEQEADEEFDKKFTAELVKGFEDHNLPLSENRLWRQAIEFSKNFQAELPASMSDDIVAIRAELVKNARQFMRQVADERSQAIKDYIGTLSEDEVAAKYPDIAKKRKKARIESVKKKRSKKKKGNAEKKLKQQEEQKAARTKPKIQSTDQLFKDMI